MPLKPSILVVDDDESMRALLASILKTAFEVFTAENLTVARQALHKTNIQIVLLDIRLKNENGLTLLREIRENHHGIEVVVITAIKEIKTAVLAMKEGAFDYITKDFDYDELHALLQKVIEKQQQSREIQYLREEVRRLCDVEMIFGRSQAMMKVKESADLIASLPATILITGETGTGKEMMARYLHAKSNLSDKPFVTVNVSAIPSELLESTLFGHEKGSFTGAHKLHYGKFELSSGGTLFLDEIGDLRLDLQTKLLRVLQENEIERVGGNKTIPVQVRLIAATNANLKEKIAKKEFREDLYYRLNVVPIHLPPLRERIEDISIFVRFFLERYNRKFGRQVKEFSQEVEQLLMLYDWPGNIRELEHLVERIVALCNKEIIGISDIPLEYQLYRVNQKEMETHEDRLQKSLDSFEKSLLLRILEETSWNQTLTSKRLGIHRKTLEYKIKRLGLGQLIDQERHRNVSA